MSSLFRRPGGPPSPGLGARAVSYLPDPERVWNRRYMLLVDPRKDRFDLLWAREIFGADPKCDDRVHLRFDHESRQAMLEFGPHADLGLAVLAPYERFTALEALRYEYLHERDWPAEDETVVGLRLIFRAGPHFLRFEASDYAKFKAEYQQRGFLGYLARLAERLGCPYREDHRGSRPADG